MLTFKTGLGLIGWEYFHRGRINDARDCTRELMELGRVLGVPRSTGLGLALLAWIAFLHRFLPEALEYSEQALAVAITPLIARCCLAKGCAFVLLQRTEEGDKFLYEVRRRCICRWRSLSFEWQ